MRLIFKGQRASAARLDRLSWLGVGGRRGTSLRHARGTQATLQRRRPAMIWARLSDGLRRLSGGFADGGNIRTVAVQAYAHGSRVQMIFATVDTNQLRLPTGFKSPRRRPWGRSEQPQRRGCAPRCGWPVKASSMTIRGICMPPWAVPRRRGSWPAAARG